MTMRSRPTPDRYTVTLRDPPDIAPYCRRIGSVILPRCFLRRHDLSQEVEGWGTRGLAQFDG